MSHTPGPWKVEEYRNHFEIWPDPKNNLGCGTMIAATHDWIPGGRVDDAANARLIAAAPELLEALKAIIEGGRMNKNSRVQYLVEIARSAVSKAV
jgi:hypothetical protein